MLTVVDDCTRGMPGTGRRYIPSGPRVARELDRIIEERGKPMMIVSDNGSEFSSNPILQWTDRTKEEWQNAFIEKLRKRQAGAVQAV
ncbi:DDE-type integrase/transposase/recombinase [Rhizobium laguerreae]|uniref:DDE-type integrase/transposase/recombinase n=1 Tax=Rhizobium laguerreae TaxID=1076926 RepID=UPI0037047C5B